MNRRGFLRAAVAAAAAPLAPSILKAAIRRVEAMPAVPVGYVVPLVNDGRIVHVINSESGWLPCDGREISRANYHALFAVLGTNYGQGSNDTFRLPDLRGHFLRGAA